MLCSIASVKLPVAMAYAGLYAFARGRWTRVQSLPEVALNASVNVEFGLDLPSASSSFPESHNELAQDGHHAITATYFPDLGRHRRA